VDDDPVAGGGYARNRQEGEEGKREDEESVSFVWAEENRRPS
jgi:hypothetical protein